MRGLRPRRCRGSEGAAVSDQLRVEWVDGGREPRCAPDPAYPKGVDVEIVRHEGAATCRTALPYPARRCGYFVVACQLCGLTCLVTTAGRPDDPRSLRVECKLPSGGETA